MEAARGIYMVVAGALVIGGSIAVVALELASSAKRRLVSPLRDTIEVVLPPVLMLALLWAVWLDWV